MQHVSISAELLGRPRLDLLFLKIGMSDISSGNIQSAGLFSVDCEVEGVEYKVVMRTELPATSELKAQVETVLQHRYCVFCCCIETKVFKNVPVLGVQAGYPKATRRNFACLLLQYALPEFSNELLRAYCATASAAFLLCNCASVVP